MTIKMTIEVRNGTRIHLDCRGCNGHTVVEGRDLDHLVAQVRNIKEAKHD